MTQNPDQRIALITGAAQRVGRAVALTLADAGFDIAFTYLTSTKPAEELASEIKSKGRQSLAIRADLTDPKTATPAILDRFKSTFTRLDLLMNNASLYSRDDATDPEQSHRFWSIHVEAPLQLTRAFTPMLQAAGGSIINMIDLQVWHPTPGFIAYCASKAGLWNLTLGLARELAPQIRVNAIAPGVVEWAKDEPPEEQQKYLRRVPLARPGTPEDVAKAVRFLALDAPYITAQILNLDGGRSVT